MKRRIIGIVGMLIVCAVSAFAQAPGSIYSAGNVGFGQGALAPYTGTGTNTAGLGSSWAIYGLGTNTATGGNLIDMTANSAVTLDVTVVGVGAAFTNAVTFSFSSSLEGTNWTAGAYALTSTGNTTTPVNVLSNWTVPNSVRWLRLDTVINGNPTTTTGTVSHVWYWRKVGN